MTMDVNAEELADVACRAAQVAGSYLRSHFRRGAGVRAKLGYFDVVTEHDSEAERLISDVIFDCVPHSTVIGEESGETGDGPVRWYVDPIDGTSNYVAGLPLYAVSVGVEVDGELRAGCVYAPQQDELFRAGDGPTTLNGWPVRCSDVASDQQAAALIAFPYEGRSSGVDEDAAARKLVDSFFAVRRLGSAALSLAYVAAGRGDVASELIAKPWDVAAGFHLVRHAGGRVRLAQASSQDVRPTTWTQVLRYVASGPLFDVDASAIADVLR